MHSWQGGGLISTMMTMKQRWQGRGVDYDEDGNEDPNGYGQQRPQLLTEIGKCKCVLLEKVTLPV